MSEAFIFNIVKEGDRHLKGRIADIIFQSIYRLKYANRFKLLSATWRNDHEFEFVMRHHEFLLGNSFSEEDIEFLRAQVVHGRGPPSFDYVGFEMPKRKILLDVKSTTGSCKTFVFSPNQRKVITMAKALGFGVYIAYLRFLENWNVEIRLIEV